MPPFKKGKALNQLVLVMRHVDQAFALLLSANP
jgi:hypothetical protein